MKDFFPINKTQPDKSIVDSSQPDVNTGVAKDVTFDNNVGSHDNTISLKSNYNNLINHFNDSIDIAETNPNLKKKNDDLDKHNKLAKESPDADPDDPDAIKQSPEFYLKQGEFITNIEDIMIPKGIAYLNGELDDETDPPPENKYKADQDTKKELVKAWARMLEERETSLSPFQQLLWVHLMAYGIPLALSVWNYIQKTMKDREAQQHEMMKTLQAMQGNARSNENPPPPPANNKPAPAPDQPKQDPDPDPAPTKNDRIVFFEENDDLVDADPDADPDPDPDPDPVEEKKPIKMNTSYKVCLHDDCNKSFEVGTGYGKGKKTKYYDQFCSKTCQFNFIGTKAVTERDKNKQKKTK